MKSNAVAHFSAADRFDVISVTCINRCNPTGLKSSSVFVEIDKWIAFFDQLNTPVLGTLLLAT